METVGLIKKVARNEDNIVIYALNVTLVSKRDWERGAQLVQNYRLNT